MALGDLRIPLNSGTYEADSTWAMDRVRSRRVGHMNIGKAAVTIRHDDGSAIDYTTAYPLLVARGLVATFAVPSSYPNVAGKLTTAQMVTMLQNGMEIAAHSATHPAADVTAIDLNAEVVAPRSVLEALNPLIRAELWVTPGTVTNMFDNDADWADVQGKLVRKTYIAGTGWSWNTQYWRSTQEPFGTAPLAMDDPAVTPLATIEEYIDEAIANRDVLHLSLHTYNLDTAGKMTVANYTALLDYIKTKVDAGVLESLTVTGGILATPWGEWEDIIREGDFQDLPYASSTWGPWIATGAPTLMTDGGPSGPNYVRVNAANHISQSHYNVAASDTEKAHYRFRCKIRSTGGAGSAQVLLQDSTTPANWLVTNNWTPANDGAWHTFSQAVTIPAGLDRVSVVVQSSGAGLWDFADIEFRRI